MDAPQIQHQPVLTSEVLACLQPERGGTFVDGTLGFGGHSELIASRLPAGSRLIGIDQDADALASATARLGERITALRGNFAEMPQLLKSLGIRMADGILLDIGVSSFQLDTPERGFSFAADGPLDMRMDRRGDTTAADLLNRLAEPELADLIYRYGEERLSRRIAKMIVERRRKQPWRGTMELAEALVECYPAAMRHKRPHPATRTFQALRIAVNDELGALEWGINGALGLLAPGGILAVITFHSLEDRIVKTSFRQAAQDGFTILTKKPLTASAEELAANPRSRSAKLRAIERDPDLS